MKSTVGSFTSTLSSTLRPPIFSVSRLQNQVPSIRLRRFSHATAGTIYNPTVEHLNLRETVRNFVDNEVRPQALEHNRDEKFNMDLFKKCGELGLLGLTVSEEYGGSGFDATASVIVHEELSRSDPAFCLSYLAHSLLFTNNLFFNGNEAQKRKYLPKACSGELIGGMCMSEPDAGTDVLGLASHAARDQNMPNLYKITGRKMWITNGCVDDKTLGDVFLVYAKTGQKTGKELSLFLVEKGYKGFSLGQRIKNKLGIRASGTAELVFDECVVPEENLVGKVGGAVTCMMRNLEIERVGLAAMSVGIALQSVDVMSKYATERKAFGKPIIDFGQIQRHVARGYAATNAARAYLYSVAGSLKLESSGNRLETDAVKLFCAEVGKDVADSAIQVLGGNGYIGDYEVERLWRDAKLMEIGGGTMESHEKNMSRELARQLKA